MLDNNFVKISETPNHFLWEIKAQSKSSIEQLIQWIALNKPSIQEKINSHGGVIFKGFNIQTAGEFETVAKAIDPNLSNLNPFDAIACSWLTEYTYEVASPLIKKSLYPLSFHNEDSFLPNVPTTIMFCALEPAAKGGETLLVDSRKVYKAIPDQVKQKFLGKYIKSTLVLPEKVFLINSRVSKNKKMIEEAAVLYGAETIKRLPNNLLQFEFLTPSAIEHHTFPVWFNVLHQTSLVNQCINTWWAYNRLKHGVLNKLKSLFLISTLLIKGCKSFLLKLLSTTQNMHSYELANNEKISLRELVQINIAYWNNAVAIPVQKGDFLWLDNRLVAHGRMPYKGKRVLLSCVGSHIKTESYNAD